MHPLVLDPSSVTSKSQQPGTSDTAGRQHSHNPHVPAASPPWGPAAAAGAERSSGQSAVTRPTHKQELLQELGPKQAQMQHINCNTKALDASSRIPLNEGTAGCTAA